MARIKDDEAVTIAFRLPRKTHELLKARAGEDSNVSEEIRRCLERQLQIADEPAEEVIEGLPPEAGRVPLIPAAQPPSAPESIAR